MDADLFMEKFVDAWADPEPEKFTRLFHPDGCLLHPGMKQPLASTDVADYIEQLIAICPDLSLQVDRWQAGSDYVLIEWTMGGTLLGQDVRWSGVDRFVLEGDVAIDGVAYFDSLPLWALVDPSMKREKTLEETFADLVGVAG